METRLIAITEYCTVSEIEPVFIQALIDEGLIEVSIVSGEAFIDTEQMPTLEQYIRWHYEMEINLEGIDALRNMLNKIKTLQEEVSFLKSRLGLYE